MKLILSTGTPWHTNYCTESGQVLYKVDSNHPSILGQQLLKISEVVAPTLSPDDTHSVKDDVLMDKFEEIGEVEYHVLGDSRIKFGGKDESTGKWFKKEGAGLYGKARVFEGPDGKEYAWRLSDKAWQLSLHLPSADGSTADGAVKVAVYHREHYSEIQGSYLEIFPAGENMRDLIVVTFVYVEKLRKDRDSGAT